MAVVQFIQTPPASIPLGPNCQKCGQAFDWGVGYPGVKGHVTYYVEGAGVFVLCEDCFAKLTPAERLPYYERLLQNEKGGWRKIPESCDLIRKAVLEGK